MVNIMVLEGLVHQISHNKSYKNLFDAEDLQQHLWEKILNIKHLLKDMSNTELMKFGRTVLNNEVFDLMRKEIRRQKFETTPDEYDVSELISRGLGVRDCHRYNYVTGEHYATEKEILHVLGAWVYQEDEETQRFITQCLEPSDQLLEQWDIMKETTRKYRCYSTIPPYTLSKMLGMKRRKFQGIEKKLNQVLKDYVIEGRPC